MKQYKDTLWFTLHPNTSLVKQLEHMHTHILLTNLESLETKLETNMSIKPDQNWSINNDGFHDCTFRGGLGLFDDINPKLHQENLIKHPRTRN